jgi:phosphatidylglycerophosphatase A
MKDRFLIALATLFSIGKFPKAPGTVGTLATIPIWFLLSKAGPIPYMLITLILIPVGVMAAQAYENSVQRHDSKEIVIDEVVGFLITMTWVPMTWQSVVIGFVIFRFLDIVKPPPIRQLDQKVGGGFGVMADDIAAGVIGSVLMQLIYNQTNWLGMQILL